VSGHIPKLLGTWGLSTIILGKSVSQERKEKERNFVWVEREVTTVRAVWEVSQVCAWKGDREKKRELGSATIGGKILEHNKHNWSELELEN
jgi:hypothetical protein